MTITRKGAGTGHSYTKDGKWAPGVTMIGPDAEAMELYRKSGQASGHQGGRA